MKFSAGLLPIDYRILQEMTKEGTELAEFIPLGPSVKALAKRIEGITGSQISGRLQTLEALGYCVPIPLLPASAGRGWQRTKKGDAFLTLVDARGVMEALAEENTKVNDERNGPSRGGTQPVIRNETSLLEPEIEPEELDWANAEVHKGSPGGEEA